jgi:RNA polymerase sigma-70 factor, ECF subfamily
MQAVTKHEDLNLSFNRLYSNHAAMIRNVVRRFDFRDAAADDLVQDIFFLAWKNIKQLKDLDALPGWLKAIARNQCANAIRSQKVQKKYFVPLEFLTSEDESTELRKVLAIELLQFEEHIKVLEDLIQNHDDPIRREVAAHFYLDHKSIKEIAQVMQLKPNTVLSHLRRFRLIVTKAMQQWMAENHCD